MIWHKVFFGDPLSSIRHIKDELVDQLNLLFRDSMAHFWINAFGDRRSHFD